MNLKKINIYLSIQICKNFFLILFIFLSVAWLLQITRLFTITNFMHIEIFDVIFLSLYLIPNIIMVITPFILIFGLLLCFIKLNKDNELVAIMSLGIGLKPFKSSLIFFSLIVCIFFTFLNFYFAPKIYEIYKNKEYELRNTVDFNSMTFSNFLNLNKTTVLDFKKNNNQYEDIFISFNDDKENFVYAKKGAILSNNGIYNFQLTNGFKISIDENQQIEKLEFLNYVLKIESQNTNIGQNIDNNTFTIIDDIYSKNYLNIAFKISDIIIIFVIILFFYNNNLRNINFETKNNIYFALLCIFLLLMNQILKNSEIILLNYIILTSSLIIILLLSSIVKKKYE